MLVIYHLCSPDHSATLDKVKTIPGLGASFYNAGRYFYKQGWRGHYALFNEKTGKYMNIYLKPDRVISQITREKSGKEKTL